MIKNYIKTAFRNIRRKPVYSAINILGLATGLACCVLILIYLQYQLSFDSFQKNSENLYRLNKIVTPKTGGTELDAITGGLMGPQLKRDYPEVKEVVRIRPWFDDVLLSRDDDHLKVPQFVLADSSFFKVFGFELLEGNPNTALAKPLSIVLSKKVATHFFGDQNPIGKTIKGLNDLNYTVTGVAENAPINSHIDYDVLVSWTSTGPSALDFGWMNRWLTQVVFTYVQLDKNTDASRLEAKFPKFMKTHFPERSDQYKLYLQPFNKIYLHSSDIHYDDELRSGSITNVYIFTAVALLVLLIACINFVNLTTARSVERGREVGVRKVLGAQRSQLGFQYLGESLGLSFLAMIVALVFIQYGEPILTYMGVPAQQATLWGNHFDILLELAIITIATGLISGIYPAVILSGFKPADTLYGKGTGKWRDDHSIRKVLVTLQFSLSIVLIIGSLIVYQQMKYLNSKDLGFQKKQILVLPLGDAGLQSKAKVFKDRVLNSTDVQEATISSTLP
ncbi:MAG: ABC transporter permease, partial [Balneolaceae bacterium]